MTFDELKLLKFYTWHEAKNEFPVCVTCHGQLRTTVDNDQANKLLVVFTLILLSKALY